MSSKSITCESRTNQRSDKVELEITFTEPPARSLTLVAIVVGRLIFMFGECGAKLELFDYKVFYNLPAPIPTVSPIARPSRLTTPASACFSEFLSASSFL